MYSRTPSTPLPLGVGLLCLPVVATRGTLSVCYGLAIYYAEGNSVKDAWRTG